VNGPEKLLKQSFRIEVWSGLEIQVLPTRMLHRIRQASPWFCVSIGTCPQHSLTRVFWMRQVERDGPDKVSSARSRRGRCCEDLRLEATAASR
jgi:hypothetical protein